jgi:hypothetical protein
MRSILAAFLVTLSATAVAQASPLLGIMFRTGGQTSGLNPILYDVNESTGAATNPRNVNVNDCVGIASDPLTGILYGMTDQFGRINNQSGQGGKNLLFSINPANGQATGIGRIDPTGVFQMFEGDLAFNPVDDSFWGVTTQVNQGTVFQINKATGLATIVSTVLPLTGTDLDLSGMTFDAAGNMYMLDTRYPNHPGPSILEKVDPATGAILQSWTTSVALGNVAGIAFDNSTGVLYAADGDTSGTNKLYSFDFNVGDLVAIGPTGAAGGIYQGLAGLTNVVPEPASAALLLLTASGLALRSRRQRRTN